MSVRKDRNQQIRPGYQVKERSTVVGRRTHYTISAEKKEGNPNDEYRVVIPKLSSNEVIYMDTARLTFKFKNHNNKSWFVNNLGRRLQKDLKI